MRRQLSQGLGEEPGIQVIGEVQDAKDLIRHAALKPSAVVIDLRHIGSDQGIAAASDLDLALVGIVDRPEQAGLLADRDLSGWAAVRPEVTSTEMAAAIRAAAAGFVVLERHMSPVPVAKPVVDELLSVREREVLKLIAEGLPNKNIGRQLGISPHTAKFHVASVLQKLGAASRTEAVSTGVRRGLLDL